MAHQIPHPANNFNFLRLLFAVLVLVSHSSELIDGDRHRELLTQVFHTISFGEFAVDGFFLLSGYLIVQSWEKTLSLQVFIKKRALRIYPGFIVASLVCAFVVGPIGAATADYFAAFSPSGLLRVALLLSPQLPPVFADTNYPAVNGSMWTIAREFCCYLLVAVMGVAGFIRKRAIWATMTAAVFLAVMLDKLGHPLPHLPGVLTWDEPIFRLASFFCAGGCAYLYRDVIVFAPRAAIVAAIVLIVAMFSAPAAEFALAICGGYLLFYFARSKTRCLSMFQRSTDISYGIYLYGWPVQKLILWYYPTMSPWMLFALSVFVSGAIATVSWHVIEKPFMKLKDRMPTPAASEVASSLQKRGRA